MKIVIELEGQQLIYFREKMREWKDKETLNSKVYGRAYERRQAEEKIGTAVRVLEAIDSRSI